MFWHLHTLPLTWASADITRTIGEWHLHDRGTTLRPRVVGDVHRPAQSRSRRRVVGTTPASVRSAMSWGVRSAIDSDFEESRFRKVPRCSRNRGHSIRSKPVRSVVLFHRDVGFCLIMVMFYHDGFHNSQCVLFHRRTTFHSWWVHNGFRPRDGFRHRRWVPSRFTLELHRRYGCVSRTIGDVHSESSDRLDTSIRDACHLHPPRHLCGTAESPSRWFREGGNVVCGTTPWLIVISFHEMISFRKRHLVLHPI